MGNAFVFSDAFDLTISLEADSLVSFAEKREAFRSAVAKAHKQLVAAMDSIEDKSSDAYTIFRFSTTKLATFIFAIKWAGHT